MSDNTPETITEQERYCKRNIENCLENAKSYYKENKERLQKMARDQYINRKLRREYAKTSYHNLTKKQNTKI